MRAILVVLFMGLFLGNAFTDPSHSRLRGEQEFSVKIGAKAEDTGNENGTQNDTRNEAARDAKIIAPSPTVAESPHQEPTESTTPKSDESGSKNPYCWVWFETLLPSMCLDDDTGTQRFMAYATLAATIFAGIASFLLLLTLLDTRKTSRAQLRAYVNVAKAKAEYFNSCEFPEQIRFMIMVENKGQTPAKNVSAWATCHVSPEFNARILVKDRSGGSVNPIGPGGELKIEYGTASRLLPIEAVQTVRNSQSNLWVHGIVEFRDVFNIRQELGFRFRVEPGPVQKPDMQICSEGNYST
jgi:hypothetical protein